MKEICENCLESSNTETVDFYKLPTAHLLTELATHMADCSSSPCGCLSNRYISVKPLTKNIFTLMVCMYKRHILQDKYLLRLTTHLLTWAFTLGKTCHCSNNFKRQLPSRVRSIQPSFWHSQTCTELQQKLIQTWSLSCRRYQNLTLLMVLLISPTTSANSDVTFLMVLII